MLEFEKIVKIQKTPCKACVTLMYTLPCQLNKDIVNHLESFGKPIYPLKTIRLLRIDSKDGYKIDGKIGKNVIKFAMPKEFANQDYNAIYRKIEFDTCLAAWIAKTLNMPVVFKQQEESQDNE